MSIAKTGKGDSFISTEDNSNDSEEDGTFKSKTGEYDFIIVQK